MTTTSFTEMTSRHRARRTGPSRNPFEGLLQSRDRKSRRSVVGLMTLAGGERLDISRIERQSMFDLHAPERC